MTPPSAGDAVLVRRAARRLGMQAALLASAIVVLLCAVAAAVVLANQRQAATMLLDAAVTRADDVADPPADVWLALQRSADVDTTPGMPAGLPDRAALQRAVAGGRSEMGTLTVAGVSYRVETLRRTDGTAVQGVLDLTASTAERNRLVTALLGAGALGLLLAAVTGTWLGRRALRPLSAALGLQRRFVADAGHELRTPVTLLHTRAQLLRRRLGRAAVTDAPSLAEVDQIVADTARLEEILEDLLVAAEPLAPRARRRVDVIGVVREILVSATPDAARRGVRLVGPGPEAAPADVLGSPTALLRAVTALVDNAVRHAAAEVTVSVHAERGSVLVDVVDDGPGIDPELASRLFDRFVSGRPDPADGRRRYGLGLALVSEIAAAHGGGVSLVHDVGGGAALRLQVPAAPAVGRRSTPRIL